MSNEILTTAEMAEADRRAIAVGVAGLTLMENAGSAVAEQAARLLRPGGRVAVVCGPGNNGGDGFVAALLLEQRGFEVAVGLVGDPADVKGDAAEMMQRWTGATAPASTDLVAGAGVIIDAIFGAGLSRAPSGLAAEMIAAINISEARVLSVDVPSGLDGATGAAPGAVVAADQTITFFRKKPGHLLLPGRSLCGDVIVADIGIPASVLDGIGSATFENATALWLSLFPWPELAGHKYGRGHAVVVSGPAEQTGAARLGARGALRIGAGLVTLIGDRTATAVNATHATAVMVRVVSGGRALAEFLEDERRNAVLIGPGATSGAETASDVLTILASKAAAILDADALTSFAFAGDSRGNFGFLRPGAEAGSTAAQLFAAIRRRAAPVVLTPHDGEFKRLFGELVGSKLERARAAAKSAGSIVVLKGADTVIAAPDGRAAINSNAPPWLATAGSGDVLAGLITGLLAQRMPAFEAACAAVWLHGEAATRFGIGLIAEDLPEELPIVLSELSPRKS